jgi:hypothetical protein
LRRIGLLLVDETPGPELAHACRLAPRALQALTDPNREWRDLFCDPTRVAIAASLTTECFGEAVLLDELARALRNDTANLIGIWGERAAPVDDAVKAVAQAAGRPLRRWLPDMDLVHALALAADTDSVLWVDTRRLQDEAHPQLAEQVATQLEYNSIPVIVSGEHPWRPTELLAVRRYLEATLAAPAAVTSAREWQRQLPALEPGAAQDLAARYRMSVSEQLAVAQTARTQRETRVNGEATRVGELCRMVAQKKAGRFARAVVPRRGPDDLILPDNIRNQVLEIPRFYRVLARVNESWGFGRLMSGGGLKALFTGDSGTGKTLAAEVIAGELDLPLLKIDLAQLVSKWVGETEKNIDAAFREAEACHAILFFDEADALFGKRSEVKDSHDRYANLEISYLLQRMEQYEGIAILATNLSDNLDQAFTRRLAFSIHFPFPGETARLKLWTRTWPQAVPIGESVDRNLLARELKIAGGNIKNVCINSAFLAAATDVAIGMEHVMRAAEHEYQKLSKQLSPNVLGKHTGV